MSMTDDTRDGESPGPVEPIVEAPAEEPGDAPAAVTAEPTIEVLDEAFIEPGPRRSTYTPPPQPNVAAAAVAVGADPETIVAEAAAAAASQHEETPSVTSPPEPAEELVADVLPGSGPTVEAPVYEAPAFEALAFEAPAFEAPAFEAPAFGRPEAHTDDAGELPTASGSNVPAGEPISEIPVWGGSTMATDESLTGTDDQQPAPTPLESFIATSTDASAAPPVYALDDVPLVDDDPPPLYFSAPPLEDSSLDSFPAPSVVRDAPEVVYDLSTGEPLVEEAHEPEPARSFAADDSPADRSSAADSTSEGIVSEADLTEPNPADDSDLYSNTPPPSFGSAQLPPPPDFDADQPAPPRAEQQLPGPGAYPQAPFSPSPYQDSEFPPAEFPAGPASFGATPFDSNTYVMPPFVESAVSVPAPEITPADGFDGEIYDISAPQAPHEAPRELPADDAPDAGPAVYTESPTVVPSLSDLPGPGMAPPPTFDSPEAQAAFLANHAAPAGRPWIPERRSMSDDDLAAALTEVASTPSQRLDAMEELERQMHLREVEAQEYSDWENSMLSVGTPEAIAAVEQLRPQFEDIVPVTTSISIITPEAAAAYEAERAAAADQAQSPVEQPPVEKPQYEAPQYEAPQHESPQYEAAPGAAAPAWMPPPPSEPSIFAQSYVDPEYSAPEPVVPDATPEPVASYAPAEPDFADVERTISFDELFGVTAARVNTPAEVPPVSPADLPAAPVAEVNAAPVAEPVFEPFADPFFGRTAAENAAATAPPTEEAVSAASGFDASAAPAFSWLIDPVAERAPEPVAEAPIDPPALIDPPAPTPPPLVEPPAFASAFENVVPSSSYPAQPGPEDEAAPADTEYPSATSLAFAEAAAEVAPEPVLEPAPLDSPADLATSAPETEAAGLPSGSFAAILGDTDIDLQRPVEPLVPAAPADEIAAAAVVTAVRSRPRAVSILVPEESGAEPTPTDRRVGRAARQFWLWFAANSSVVSLGFGGVLFSLGMSLRQAIIATLAGVVLSFIPLGLGTLAGKRSGQPTMVVSRATFGVYGNILPAVISLVTRLFWGAALLWVLAAAVAATLVGAGASGGLSEPQLVILGLAVGFVLALVVAFFGYGLLARFQLVVSIVSGVLVIGLIALTADKIDVAQALTIADGPLPLVLTGAVLVFSFVGLVWANSSSDLARYQRPGSSSGSSMLWATFGTTLPTFGLISYGALLAASDPQIAAGLVSNPLDTLGRMLPTWYPIPLIAATALSLLSGVVISIYSGGFALQAAGVRLKRQWSVLIVGVILVVIAWVISTLVGDLTLIFRDIATTLAVPVAAWAGIFAAETMIRNRPYDSASLLKSGGLYPSVRVVNFIGLILITVIGYALTTATLSWLSWQGFGLELIGIPLGSDLAASDFGVLVALVLGLVLPLAAGIPAIRRQEAALNSAPIAVVAVADAAAAPAAEQALVAEPAPAAEPAPIGDSATASEEVLPAVLVSELPVFGEPEQQQQSFDEQYYTQPPVQEPAQETVQEPTQAFAMPPAAFPAQPPVTQFSGEPLAQQYVAPPFDGDPLAHLLAEPVERTAPESAPSPFAAPVGEPWTDPDSTPGTAPASPRQPN